jgi:hypothetical protein
VLLSSCDGHSRLSSRVAGGRKKLPVDENRLITKKFKERATTQAEVSPSTPLHSHKTSTHNPRFQDSNSERRRPSSPVATSDEQYPP